VAVFGGCRLFPDSLSAALLPTLSKKCKSGAPRGEQKTEGRPPPVNAFLQKRYDRNPLAGRLSLLGFPKIRIDGSVMLHGLATKKTKRQGMLTVKKSLCIGLFVVASLFAPDRLIASTEPRTGAFLANLQSKGAHPKHPDSHVQYAFSGPERYYIYVPAAYTGSQSYGLIVFTDATSGTVRLPAIWQTVLDTRKYIFIAAQNAGNDQRRGRRLGLAVLGARKIMSRYRIDPNRVYAAGFSGGSRMSGLLGFYQADIFHGTIQICGADFYERVPIVAATSQLDTAGMPYGRFDATEQEISNARAVRFVLITGTRDFRQGNILDVFHGGFERGKFQAKLIDVPGMDHTICDRDVLSIALDFLEGK
jgi:hypothetical protein